MPTCKHRLDLQNTRISTDYCAQKSPRSITAAWLINACRICGFNCRDVEVALLCGSHQRKIYIALKRKSLKVVGRPWFPWRRSIFNSYGEKRREERAAIGLCICRHPSVSLRVYAHSSGIAKLMGRRFFCCGDSSSPPVFNTCQMPFWPSKIFVFGFWFFFCFFVVGHFTKMCVLGKGSTFHNEGLSKNDLSQNTMAETCKIGKYNSTIILAL